MGREDASWAAARLARRTGGAAAVDLPQKLPLAGPTKTLQEAFLESKFELQDWKMKGLKDQARAGFLASAAAHGHSDRRAARGLT